MLVLALFGACNAKQPMESSNIAPASEGTVSTSKGENGNTLLTLKVKHLAPASRLAADARVYVAWIQPQDGVAQNVGVLTLDANLEGTLSTLTPHLRFRLLVTPEPSGQVEKPSHAAVFDTPIERAD